MNINLISWPNHSRKYAENHGKIFCLQRKQREYKFTIMAPQSFNEICAENGCVKPAQTKWGRCKNKGSFAENKCKVFCMYHSFPWNNKGVKYQEGHTNQVLTKMKLKVLLVKVFKESK
jgi:hypothetical protein